jgi:Cellulase (glycosyl hydrolase family 5)
MNHRTNFFLVILLLSFLSATTSADAVASTLPGLSISGIEIVANGQPVRLHGVNMGDPFWARNPDWYNYSPADYHTLSQEWRANVVRISIFPTQWKNMDHTTLLNGLSQEINAALDNEMYVIISYHVIGWPDGFYQEAYPGNPADTYDSSMSVATSFWSAMAQAYGSDTRIIFVL